MAAGILIFPGAQPSRSRQGTVISAELRWYVNETDTPATVYTDPALTVPHQFPIVSDDAGRFPLIYADDTEVFSCSWSTAAPDSQAQSYDFISPTTAADTVLLDEMNAVLSDAMDLYESLADVDAAVEEARGYAAEAADIVAGASGTNATSSTSLSIGTGTKSLTVGANLLYVPGMNVVIASSASPSNQMSGPVQTYNAGTGALVVDAINTSGSGAFSSWTVSLSGATFTIASQGEAQAGTDNTKVMTPLRVADAFSALRGWTEFKSVTPTGTTVSSGTIPAAYNDVVIVFDDVVLSSSLTPTIAISSDGSTFGSATDLVGAANGTFSGEIAVNGVRRNQGSIVVSLKNGTVSDLSIVTSTPIAAAEYLTFTWRASGGIEAIRLALSTAGSYSSGTMRFYGR